MRQEFNEDFATRYQEKYDKEPDLYAAIGHSIAHILLTSLDENNWELDDLTDKFISKKWDDTAIVGFELREDRTVTMPLLEFWFTGGKLEQLK